MKDMQKGTREADAQRKYQEFGGHGLASTVRILHGDSFVEHYST